MRKRYRNIRNQLAILGFCIQFSYASNCAAGPHIPGFYGKVADVVPPSATALPTGFNIRQGVDSIETIAGKRMIVHQDEKNAVIHWDEFNIGRNASVHFDQSGRESWKAINRVTGNGYSQIYGSLTADGQVYLINQNGILFGPGSQVNVHSLVASSLNLSDEDFLGPSFADATNPGSHNYFLDQALPSRSGATVANHGTIRTGPLGIALLIGPRVENHGTIETPGGGQIGLAAGEAVEVYQRREYDSLENAPRYLTIAVQGSGSSTAANFAAGQLVAERGDVGMYGDLVNQDGTIRAVTALEANGRIELKARYRVRTGPESHTDSPISDSKERTVMAADAFKTGEIRFEATEGTVEHHGSIEAPGGRVIMRARDRVSLEKGSAIDVSGAWVGLSGDDRVIEVQLNSKELRDSFALKDGPLLGEKVEVDTITGLAIADISEYLTSQAQSALERAVEGGTITLNATGDNGEVIVKKDAQLDFGGGGRIYGEGLIKDTLVRVGQKVYTLSELPPDTPVDEVLGHHEVTHERYGLTDQWDGLYYGGAAPLERYLPSFKQGADAGELIIEARKTVLAGVLNAGVVRGLYQTMLEDPVDDNGNPTATGRKVPKAGTLRLGTDDKFTKSLDYLVDAIVVGHDLPAETVGADGALADSTDPVRVSSLDAGRLNDAHLGTLNLRANTSITIAEGASIAIEPGGSFSAKSERVEHHGEIVAPGGTVELKSIDTVAAEAPQPEQVVLARGSLISVAGERVDNSQIGSREEYRFGITTGGSITLENAEIYENWDGGVAMAPGAAVDISGGYEIGSTGAVTGGDAGTFSVIGRDVTLDGELKGHALIGSNGGTLQVHADSVVVATSAAARPRELDVEGESAGATMGGYLLSQDRLAGTGISHVDLTGSQGLIVEEGVRLTPSVTRLRQPQAGSLASGFAPLSPSVEAPAEYAGSTSISLSAGKTRDGNVYNDAMVEVSEDALLAVAPEGEITLDGRGGVAVAGGLLAPAGAIAISSDQGDVTVGSGSRLDAAGTVLPDPESTLAGMPENHQALAGGSVKIAAANGSVALEEGSLVDVSGSGPVVNTMTDNQGGFATVTDAAPAGSLEIEYREELSVAGRLRARSGADGLPGATLAVSKNNPGSALTLEEESLAVYAEAGFDDLTFRGMKAIDFVESEADEDRKISLAAGRRLTLNTREIIARGDETVSLAAPWIRLWNIKPGTLSDSSIQVAYSDQEGPAAGEARFEAEGHFIDIRGDLALSGFGETSLTASHDLRLYDYLYTSTSVDKWSGALRTGGDITLQAAAIYPASYHSPAKTHENEHTVIASVFKIKTPGRVTTLPGDAANRQPIYSAGGTLTIEAGEIEHRGELAAPLGTVVLQAGTVRDRGKILLAKGSRITTRGEGTVLYGNLADRNWQTFDKSDTKTSPTVKVDTAPEKGVVISGYRRYNTSTGAIEKEGPAPDIVQAPGADIDVGGGGTVFAYEFLPGFDGSNNPLNKEGRYVVLPDNSITLPGQAITLEGSDLLPAGTYTVLPDEYAFLPGAVIVEQTDTTMLPGEVRTTSMGYTMVPGFETVTHTGIRPPARQGYVIRSAAEVLAQEGRFDMRQLIAGDAGSVEITGSTALLAGTVYGDALPGSRGAVMALSGKDISFGSLPEIDWQGLDDFEAGIPGALEGTMALDTGQLEGKGIEELRLGDRERGTTSVTMLAGSTLTDIPRVTLSAEESVTLEAGATLHATASEGERQAGTTGEIFIDTDTVVASKDTLLHASDRITWEVTNLNPYDFQGDFQVDNSAMTFSGDRIYLEPVGYTGSRSESGIYLTAAMRERFAAIENIELASRSDIVFLGSVDMEVKENLTFDAARIAVDNQPFDDPEYGPPRVYPYSVTVRAGNELVFRNSGAKESSADLDLNSNTIDFAAGQITFGPGYAYEELENWKKVNRLAGVTFDNFKSVSFTSRGDTVFEGTGSLTADLPGQGRMRFSAGRYRAAMHRETLTDADGSESAVFDPADFTVESSDGALVLSGGGKDSGSVGAPGSLIFRGQSIRADRGARIELPGGRLAFEAENDIDLTRASISATGGSFTYPFTAGGERFETVMSMAGGTVAMRSATGAIRIGANSTVDVSADDGQQGGSLSLAAFAGSVELDGTLRGSGGRGGSFAMETDSIGDFGALADTLRVGGFGRGIALRARTGDVAIEQADTVEAERFKLVVDEGRLDVWGMIDVSGPEAGGTVEMVAGSDLTLHESARILARGTGENAAGGEVFLGTAEGVLASRRFSHPEYGTYSALIDVSGSGKGKGGSVTFRAPRSSIDQVRLDGEIRGAAKSVIQAVQVYEKDTVSATDLATYEEHFDWSTYQMVTTLAGGMLYEAKNFVDSTPWRYADSIDLIPEIEVRSSGTMTIGKPYGTSEPILLYEAGLEGYSPVLTFRAKGDLKVRADIIDVNAGHVNTYAYPLTNSPVTDGEHATAALNFVAGADLASADVMAVTNGTGDFIVGNELNGKGNFIFTESAPIRFASGNDTRIMDARAATYDTEMIEMLEWNGMLYPVSVPLKNVKPMPGPDEFSLASFSGDIAGEVGGNLSLEGGVIQTAVSDIEMTVGGDVAITKDGAIRTVGRAPMVEEVSGLEQYKADMLALAAAADDPAEQQKYEQWALIADTDALFRFWDYRDGGDISLTVAGSVSGGIDDGKNGSGWDHVYVDQLLGDYHEMEDLPRYWGAAYGAKGFTSRDDGGGQAARGIVALANGDVSITAGGDFYGQAGVFGSGDLGVSTGGDLDGRFLAMDGTASLVSRGSFGSRYEDSVAEIGDTGLTISAMGNLALGTVSNPHLINPITKDGAASNNWHLTYTEETSVDLNAALGDVSLSGVHPLSVQNNRALVLPASLEIKAGGDILFSNFFKMTPAHDGSLRLLAGGDIDGRFVKAGGTLGNSTIVISDADPATLYGDHGFGYDGDNALLLHDQALLHADDPHPVEVKAGGDISHLGLTVPKRTELVAGRDIREIDFSGQNVGQDDVTLISAGRDIDQQLSEGYAKDTPLGIEQAGPGYILVQAGNSVELGTSEGIVTVGDRYNAALRTTVDGFGRSKGSDLAVIVGYDLEPDPKAMSDFFQKLQVKGAEFSRLMATGEESDKNAAARLKQEMVDTIIDTMLAGRGSGEGNLSMTGSQIKTASGQDDLSIFARGQVDVGTTVMDEDAADRSKGILTEGGGDINLFAEGDINVNESRVVTFFGGNVFLLSNHGDINAGRGSTTSVSPAASKKVEIGGRLVPQYSAPGVGSGIRTLSYDPDGAGSYGTPKRGDIYLIAWEGVIDAGEAGIDAGKVIMAAEKILNSQNISFSDSGVGVPVTTDAGPSIGAITGSSTINESDQIAKETGEMATADGHRLAEAMATVAESLKIRMVVVKFIGFGS